MEPKNLNLGELYAIPEVGEPVKIEKIRNIEFKTLDVKEYENEPNFVFNMPNDFNLTLKIISYSKILNRFARKNRRYMRRKNQQEKRRRNNMKTNEN